MLLGIDTSRYEDDPTTPKTIDWQVAKDAGVHFVILKATEGSTYVDPVFALHKNNLHGVIPRGSYHFWRWQYSAQAQADHYFKVASNLELPPCLDVEDWYNDLPKGAQLETRIIEMLDAVDKAFGRECMLYTSPNILKYYLALKPTSPLCNRKLWLAQYSLNPPVPADYYPFSRYSFWQFTDNGDASLFGINEAGGVDLNWYNGTQDDFSKEFSQAMPPLPDPIPSPITISLKSITDITTGVLIPKNLKAEITRSDMSSTYVLTIDQTPVVVPPVDKSLWNVSISGWQKMRGMDRPPSQGPYTCPMARENLLGRIKPGSVVTSLSLEWQNYIHQFNDEVAWGKIIAWDYGPSKGIDTNGNLKYIGLVYPNLGTVNQVRVLEWKVGTDGLVYGLIESIPMNSIGKTYTPQSHPQCFHEVYNWGGVKIICPILGYRWWVPRDVLTQ